MSSHMHGRRGGWGVPGATPTRGPSRRDASTHLSGLSQIGKMDGPLRKSQINARRQAAYLRSRMDGASSALELDGGSAASDIG